MKPACRAGSVAADITAAGNCPDLPLAGSGLLGRYLRPGPFQTQPHLFARCPDWWGPPALRIFSTNRLDETLVSANGGGGLDGWLFRRLCLFALLPTTVIALLLLGFSTYWHRSEEHTSELQSLMRISYAVFCLKKTNIDKPQHSTITKHT